MMASLYHKESLSGIVLFKRRRNCEWKRRSSRRYILHDKEMPRLKGWIEPNVVSHAAPCVARARQQIVHHVRLFVVDSHLVNRDVHHRLLHVMRIGGDGDEQMTRAAG